MVTGKPLYTQGLYSYVLIVCVGGVFGYSRFVYCRDALTAPTLWLATVTGAIPTVSLSLYIYINVRVRHLKFSLLHSLESVPRIAYFNLLSLAWLAAWIQSIASSSRTEGR